MSVRHPFRVVAHRVVAGVSGAAIAIALSACGGGGLIGPAATPFVTVQPTPTSFPVTVRDSSGVDVTVPAPPRRIISLSPGMTETLFAIGAGEQVVATDQFSDYPEGTKRAAKLDYSRPEAEKVVALQPDIVFMSSHQEEFVDQFRKLNVRVLYLAEPDTLDGVIEQIRTAGRVTGREARAEEIMVAMRQRIDGVTERLTTLTQGPRVFMELDETGHTTAPHSFVGSMVTVLKAQNIAAGSQAPYPQLSREVIVQRNPEVIILLDANYGETPQKVRLRPGWATIAAVRTGRVYPIDSNIVNRPGPRVVEGLEQLAKLLYPERFP
jgi:iron complex transport system substrate-binding protein